MAGLQTAGTIDVGDFRFEWLGSPDTCTSDPVGLCANANVVSGGFTANSGSITITPTTPPLVGTGQDMAMAFNVYSLSGRQIIAYSGIGTGTAGASLGATLYDGGGNGIPGGFFTVTPGAPLSQVFFSGQASVASNVDVAGGSGSWNSVTLTAYAAPEPGTLALIGTGVVVLAGLRRRRAV